MVKQIDAITTAEAYAQCAKAWLDIEYTANQLEPGDVTPEVWEQNRQRQRALEAALEAAPFQYDDDGKIVPKDKGSHHG